MSIFSGCSNSKFYYFLFSKCWLYLFYVGIYILSILKKFEFIKKTWLKFPINLLVEKTSFEIIQLKDHQLLKMSKNIDDVAIYKYYDMIQNKIITTNAKFKLVSPKNIIINHGHFSWLNDF